MFLDATLQCIYLDHRVYEVQFSEAKRPNKT